MRTNAAIDRRIESKLEIKVFEISARIVAGTNLFPQAPLTLNTQVRTFPWEEE